MVLVISSLEGKDIPVLSMCSRRPDHGGGLNHAFAKYTDSNTLDKDNWLDLSTGINPNGWPVPVIPARVYNRLPEKDDGLIEVAQAYYQIRNILPVSGSQEAIQLLPVIFHQHHLLAENPKVGIVSPCYAEHEFQWKKNNFTVVHLDTDSVDDVIDDLDVLVLINPNNPTGELVSARKIKNWQNRLNQKKGQKKGFMIVDEAFMDSTPQKTVISESSMDNLIVLRSIGKFFGLAGVRCGFVIASPDILSLLEYHQGPWSVSGPTRWLVKKVLGDEQWIKSNRMYLKEASIRMENLLKKHLLKKECLKSTLFHQKEDDSLCGTLLFKTVLINHASVLFEQLANRGVLVRLLDESCLCPSCAALYGDIKSRHKGLRFGLPANERQWQYLESVFEDIV